MTMKKILAVPEPEGIPLPVVHPEVRATDIQIESWQVADTSGLLEESDAHQILSALRLERDKMKTDLLQAQVLLTTYAGKVYRVRQIHHDSHGMCVSCEEPYPCITVMEIN